MVFGAGAVYREKIKRLRKPVNPRSVFATFSNFHASLLLLRLLLLLEMIFINTKHHSKIKENLHNKMLYKRFGLQ